MTKQDQNPEKPRKIEIKGTDLAPTRIEVREEDLGEQTGKIALSEADFGKTEDKLAKIETKATRSFKDFVRSHLPEESDEDGYRQANYRIKAEGQLIPVSEVQFSEGASNFSEELELDFEPGEARSLEIFFYGNGDHRVGSGHSIRYDERAGFISVDGNGQSLTEVSPQDALDTIAILSAAADRGDLKPLEPATHS